MVCRSIFLLMALVTALFVFSLTFDNPTRVRNSLVADIGSTKDFLWMPEGKPVTYHSEILEAPDELVEIVSSNISIENLENDNFKIGLLISEHLIGNKRYSYAIQNNIIKTYTEILEGGGYCADYEKVFTALAHVYDVPVKRWGFGNKGYGAGHAFNEIWDDKLNKWVMIDSYHSFYFIDKKTNIPLSVLEIQDYLNNDVENSELDIVKIDPDNFGFNSLDETLAYYKAGYDQFYLFWGDDVFSYDANNIVSFFSNISRPMEIFSAIAVGAFPKIKILATDTSEKHTQHLWITKIIFITLFISIVIVFFFIALQFLRIFLKKTNTA